eukprot:SAG11_NODE_8807_length_974_cov_1.728000_1_plen_120_part_00
MAGQQLQCHPLPHVCLQKLRDAGARPRARDVAAIEALDSVANRGDAVDGAEHGVGWRCAEREGRVLAGGGGRHVVVARDQAEAILEGLDVLLGHGWTDRRRRPEREHRRSWRQRVPSWS